MIEWTISLGSIVTIISIFFAAAGFYWKQTFDSREFKQDIIDIKVDLKILNKVIMDLALQNQRMDNLTDRLNYMDRQVEELKHGKGYVK